MKGRAGSPQPAATAQDKKRRRGEDTAPYQTSAVSYGSRLPAQSEFIRKMESVLAK